MTFPIWSTRLLKKLNRGHVRSASCVFGRRAKRRYTKTIPTKETQNARPFRRSGARGAMATSRPPDFLEIKTKSIEQTLLPLIKQVNLETPTPEASFRNVTIAKFTSAKRQLASDMRAYTRHASSLQTSPARLYVWKITKPRNINIVSAAVSQLCRVEGRTHNRKTRRQLSHINIVAAPKLVASFFLWS